MKKLLVLLALVAFSSQAQVLTKVSSGEKISSAAYNQLLDKVNALTNVVQNHIVTESITPFNDNRANAAYIGPLATTITTRVDNSKVLYEAVISYEAQHDGAFILERSINGGANQEIGSALNPGNRFHGIAPIHFDNNEESTMAQISIKFLDEPNAPAGANIQYFIRVFGTGSAGGFSLNRTLLDSNIGTMERATSTVLLKEVPQ